MNKIPTIFVRDPRSPQRLTDERHPECIWVFNGEGVPTRKYDGTACLFRDGKIYKRYDCKKGRTPPEGFEPCGDPDPLTGHWPGWLPASESDPADRWIFDAPMPTEDGTYELIGPKVQGNPEHMPAHALVRHGATTLSMPFAINKANLETFLRAAEIEGIVWHHSDGRMAKVKRRDFGLPWPITVPRARNLFTSDAVARGRARGHSTRREG